MKTLKIIAAIAFFAFSPASAEAQEATDPTDLALQVLEHGITSLDPKDIMVWADMPRSANKGDDLVLRITVENARDTEPFAIESIDLGGNMADGFEVLSIDPIPDATDGMFNTLTLEYSTVVAAGKSVEFKIELRAIEEGVFIGEVDVWEGDQFLTRIAQCKISDVR